MSMVGLWFLWFYVRENLKAQPPVVLRRWGSQLKVSSVNWWSRRSCGYFILILKSALSLYHFMMTSYGLTLKLKYFMLQLKLGKAEKSECMWSNGSATARI